MANQDPSSTRRPFHRGPWGSAVWIDDHFCRIRIKNPMGPLQVNTIAYRDAHVLLLIDPGWPWTLDAITQALRDLGLIKDSLGEVTHFLYTHTHIDHMGSAALISTQHGASHHFLAALAPLTPAWHNYQDRLGAWDEWMVEVVAGPWREHVRAQLFERGPRRTMTETFGEMGVQHGQHFLVGDTLEFGDLSLNVLDVSGHDPHHVAFLDTARELLISGDVTLPIPTPIMRIMGDDLTLYEASLERLCAMKPPKILIPGHGTQVIGEEQVRAHIQKSRDFVDHYWKGVRRILDDVTAPIGLWEIAATLDPGRRVTGEEMRWWALMGQLEARLGKMVETGEVARIDQGDGPRYKRA